MESRQRMVGARAIERGWLEQGFVEVVSVGLWVCGEWLKRGGGQLWVCGGGDMGLGLWRWGCGFASDEKR